MITVAKEKDLGWPLEQCYFCHKGTQYWSVKKDIPVCRTCAEWKQEWHLPEKDTWASNDRKSKKEKSITLR